MGLHGVRELVHVEARGRRVPVDFMILSILSQIYYWDGYPKIINVFGSYFMITCICVTKNYTIWDRYPKFINVFGMNIPKLLMFLGLLFPKLLMFLGLLSQNY